MIGIAKLSGQFHSWTRSRAESHGKRPGRTTRDAPRPVMSVLLARHAGSQPRNRYMSSQTLWENATGSSGRIPSTSSAWS